VTNRTALTASKSLIAHVASSGDRRHREEN
jgi:hypothetical protein